MYVYGYGIIQENHTSYDYPKLFSSTIKRKIHLQQKGFVVDRCGELVKQNHKTGDERVFLFEYEVI